MISSLPLALPGALIGMKPVAHRATPSRGGRSCSPNSAQGPSDQAPETPLRHGKRTEDAEHLELNIHPGRRGRLELRRHRVEKGSPLLVLRPQPVGSGTRAGGAGGCPSDANPAADADGRPQFAGDSVLLAAQSACISTTPCTQWRTLRAPAGVDRLVDRPGRAEQRELVLAEDSLGGCVQKLPFVERQEGSFAVRPDVGRTTKSRPNSRRSKPACRQ